MKSYIFSKCPINPIFSTKTAKTLLSENTIIGLHVVKEAVRFFDPVSNQPEKIAITDDLRRFVRNAHAAYKERLERERG